MGVAITQWILAIFPQWEASHNHQTGWSTSTSKQTPFWNESIRRLMDLNFVNDTHLKLNMKAWKRVSLPMIFPRSFWIAWSSIVLFGKDPARASRSVVVFSCLRHCKASISFHVLHCFLARHCMFCAFCCVSWRACGDSCVLACQGLFGGWDVVGGWGGVGWGGVGGGLITFLFINVPPSSFLTRFSLLQVTVWHAVDVSVLICWRWCPVACGHGVGFGGD